MSSIVDDYAARRARARLRRSRRWLLPCAGLAAVVAVASLVVPTLERVQIEYTVDARARRLFSGAAWRWHSLVAAGMSPGDATDRVSEAIHAHLVSSKFTNTEIPLVAQTDMEALHDSFRLNPFIRSTQLRTIDPVERRELSESATRVAVLTTAVRRHEFDRADAAARRHLLWGALIALVAGGASAWLFIRWRQRTGIV